MKSHTPPTDTVIRGDKTVRVVFQEEQAGKLLAIAASTVPIAPPAAPALTTLDASVLRVDFSGGIGFGKRLEDLADLVLSHPSRIDVELSRSAISGRDRDLELIFLGPTTLGD